MDDILKTTMLQNAIAVKEAWSVNDLPIVGCNGNSGLCDHIKIGVECDHRSVVQDKLRQCFRMWPEYSGNPAYPVPHPDDEDIDAECTYDQLDLWTGPYGEARMRLLDFIIQTISEELHNAV